MCGKGNMQSPIDLTDKRVLIDHNLGYLRSQYLPSNATIKNRGHDIMVNQLLAFPICIFLDHNNCLFLWQMKFEGGNAGLGITINGTEYKLQQIHWHSPSEHTLNGKRYLSTRSYTFVIF